MIRIPFAAAGLALLCACSSLDTSIDYDTKADFSHLSNYAWIETGDASLTGRRIQTAVDAALGRRGYALASEAPSFLVAAHIGRQDRVQVTDWGYSYPRYGGAWYGAGDLDVYTYQEGSLVLDVIDAKTRELMWRGTATRVIDPGWTAEERDKIVAEAVEALLEHFPPKP